MALITVCCQSLLNDSAISHIQAQLGYIFDSNNTIIINKLMTSLLCHQYMCSDMSVSHVYNVVFLISI